MAEFQVIYGDKAVPKENWSVFKSEEIDIWGNPQDANTHAKALNLNYKRLGLVNYAAMIKRLPDPIDYLARECARDGYTPFEIQGEPHHCAELKSDGNISHYNTLYDAYDDRRTDVKLGRYLRKWTDKNDNEIADICARYGVEFGDAQLKFARTVEEIYHVYTTGPRSCMSCDADEYSIGGGIHPSAVYASEDFGVAYITRDEKVTARTVVAPNLKLYACIYGDSTRMRALLQDAGYRQIDESSQLHGLKLNVARNDGKIALPFFDWDAYVKYSEDKKHLILCSSREGSANWSEYGYVYDDLSCAEDPYDDYDDDYY